jgi:hypothetical protein
MNPTTQRSPLSDLQGKVLAYLVKFLAMNDQLPTCDNIAAAFGWASSNSADTHLKAMEKKGYLVRNELGRLMLADRPAVAPALAKPNPEMQSSPGLLRDHIHRNLGAMDTTVASLIACVYDDDAEYSLELCSNLLSQTRGLVGMLEAAVARGVGVSKEVAHG